MKLLLVEDNPIDVRAIRRAIAGLERDLVVEVVSDGNAAIAFLRSAETERPDLVLLDLNLPGRDGFDVLRFVKSDPDLKRLPVLVLTTSASDADVVGAYDLGANAFVTKPSGLDGWQEVFARIEGFWLSTVRLPPS